MISSSGGQSLTGQAPPSQREPLVLDHYSWLKQPALVAPAVAQHIVGEFGAR